MATAAQHPKLKTAFTGHLGETRGQVVLLEEVFGLLDLKPRGKHCDGIATSPVRDAALAAGGRRAEHYEIAAYSSMIAMGKALGYTDACKKLSRILGEEEAADRKLTELGLAILEEAHQEEPVEV